MNAETKKTYMTIPLGEIAHGHARKFAKLQVDPDKSTQVYRNILTIYAAHCYLQILQIESDLEQSEGWNLAIATLQDTASLHLPKFGDLECRLVHTDDIEIDLPTSAQDDKIGLLVFRANELDVSQIEEMEVIGFEIDLSQLSIEIAQLPPADKLLDRLEMLELLTPVLVYVPDLSIDEIKTALEKIYQQSDDLRFEYNIGKFLKAGRERTKMRVAEDLMKFIQAEDRELALARERSVNPDRELQALAAELAEQLQDLWGRLD
jgi:Protein of unknown function (DUF1822)